MFATKSAFRAPSIRSAAALVALGVAIALTGALPAQATENPSQTTATVELASAANFAVLAASTVTNTDSATIVRGELGVAPGTSVTGFPPGQVRKGSIHSADAVAAQAQLDAKAAYNDAAGRVADEALGVELGGRTLTPGVYSGGTFEITGTLTLKGDENSVFIFQTASTLVTATASKVRLVGGVNPANVFWKVGSSATLATYSKFSGTVLAHASIASQTGAIVNGRLIALTAAVTMDDNKVRNPQIANARC